MIEFELSQSQEELTGHSGLTLVGYSLYRMKNWDLINNIKLPNAKVKPHISHSDVLKSYVAGKSDYEAIEEYRPGDKYFPTSLGINSVASCETLRQRMDQLGAEGKRVTTVLKEENLRMLRDVGVTLTPTLRKMVALDIDVSPFDNSKTQKEEVSRTYQGFDGYAPIFAYLGEDGYLVNLELRPGKQHCQNHTPVFLRGSLRLARLLTDAPLLVRMDSGNDAVENISICEESGEDYIIKRNLRKESPHEWLKIAKAEGNQQAVREGKTVFRGSRNISKTLTVNEKQVHKEIRCAYEITERTIKENGQMLMVPEIEVEAYWTSLPDPVEVIVKLYHLHGTSEQFHSEIKTDMDVERLPSGKFKTNQLVMHCTMLAYNILRMIGQIANQGDDLPMSKPAKRRRIRTVIQNLIYLAARLVSHARRYKLSFGRWSPWFPAYFRVYQQLRC